jgi:hypothetical protein
MQEQKAGHPFLERLGFLIGSVVSTVFLLVCIWGVVLVRQFIPLVGLFIVFSIPVLVTVGLIVLVSKGLATALEHKSLEIGPNGNILQRWGKVTHMHPLGLREYRVKEVEAAKKAEKVEVPSMLSLLKEGLIDGVELLLGFHLDGTPRYGMWDDLRTFIVAGKSRSGKTVTMVFFILQALLSGAVVYVCDPHHRKDSGLLKILAPVVPWMYTAKTQEEIIALAKAFTQEILARENGTSMDKRPCLFVVDEWTKLLRDLAPYEVEIMVEVFLNCAEAWAGFGGFAIIGGHEWTARESGGKRGAALRKNTHASFVHRLDADYAKFLLQGSKGKKAANNAPNLPRGHSHLQDAEGELDYLIIPFYGAKKEAIIEVAYMLSGASLENTALPSGDRAGLVGPEYTAIAAPGNAINGYGNRRQTEETPINAVLEPLQGNEVQVYNSATSMQAQYEQEAPVTTVGVNTEKLSDTQIKALVMRMHKRNISMRDIAYSVSLYGRNYDQFKALCKEVGISLTENA